MMTQPELSYPNISFGRSIIGPQPTTRPWRDELGVAGEFSRGPVDSAVIINNRQDFAQLFGEDSSSGSLFVQQAMAQGATNFVISRAVPDASPSKAVLKFGSSNPNIAPQIGYSVLGNSLVPSPNRYTTGLTLNMDYIGAPNVRRTLYGSVSTLSLPVTHPTFEGRARFRFLVTDYQQGMISQDFVSPGAVIPVTIGDSPISGYQVVSVPKTAANWATVEPFIRPGFALKESTPAFQDETVTIVTKPFSLNNTQYGFIVKGHHGQCYVARINAATGGDPELVIRDLFSRGVAITSPDLDILEKMNIHIEGYDTVFKQSGTPVSTGLGTYVLDLTANAPDVQPDDKISLRPRVFSINLTTNVVVVEGVLADDFSVGNVSFYGSEDTYEVTGVVYSAVTGRASLTLAEPINSNKVKVGLSALSSSPTAASHTLNVRVAFSRVGHYLIGYKFEPTGLASLNSGGSSSYYTLSDETYDDGYTEYSVDNYIALAEDRGGEYIDFKHLMAPTTSEATPLALEGVGIAVRYGEEGVKAISLLEKGQYIIPFARSSVSVGGPSFAPVAFTVGQSVIGILAELEAQIYTNQTFSSLLSTVTTQNYLPPYSTTLLSGFYGNEANRIKWSLDRYVKEFDTVAADTSTAGLLTLEVENLPAGASNSDRGIYLLRVDGSPVEHLIASWNVSTKVVTFDDTTPLAITTNTGTGVHIYSQTLTTDLLFNEDTAGDGFYPEDGTVEYGILKSFTGGFNGPTYAQLDLYSLNNIPVLKVMALSPGSFGNKLKVTVIPGVVNGGFASFEVQVVDINQNIVTGPNKVESFFLSTSEVDSQSGLFTATNSSTLIRAFFIPLMEAANITGATDTSMYGLMPLRVAPALELYSPLFGGGLTAISAQGGSYLQDIMLQGATDYIPATTDKQLARLKGYESAVARLEGQNIAVLAVPGITYGDDYFNSVFELAKTQAENSTPQTGLRIAVFEAPAGASDRQVALLASRLNSEQVILLRGHQTMRASNGISYSSVGASGTYSGYVFVRPPHISPASAHGGSLPEGVLNVDTPAISSYLDTITRGHAEALAYDSGLRRFRFWNGITTSADPLKKYISVRRIFDQIVTDLYENLQWVRSEPNTRELQRKTAAACDAYLQGKLREEWLIRVAPTICGPENNTITDMVSGILRIRIRATSSFPADFIKVHIIDDRSEDFSLQVVPSVVSEF